MILAQTQAAYDGACMVYGRNEARSFLESPDSAGHAFVSTFTTDGTALNTFAHYSSESQGQTKYHQYPTSSSFLISSYEDFKTSRRQLRNLQDDAKVTSEKLRDELNEKLSANRRSPVAPSVQPRLPTPQIAIITAMKMERTQQVNYSRSTRRVSRQTISMTLCKFPLRAMYMFCLPPVSRETIRMVPSYNFPLRTMDTLRPILKHSL
jgi:hypothetical protein